MLGADVLIAGHGYFPYITLGADDDDEVKHLGILGLADGITEGVSIIRSVLGEVKLIAVKVGGNDINVVLCGEALAYLKTAVKEPCAV